MCVCVAEGMQRVRGVGQRVWLLIPMARPARACARAASAHPHTHPPTHTHHHTHTHTHTKACRATHSWPTTFMADLLKLRVMVIWSLPRYASCGCHGWRGAPGLGCDSARAPSTERSQHRHATTPPSTPAPQGGCQQTFRCNGTTHQQHVHAPCGRHPHAACRAHSRGTRGCRAAWPCGATSPSPGPGTPCAARQPR
jgi:hypothetical protein